MDLDKKETEKIKQSLVEEIDNLQKIKELRDLQDQITL